MSTSTPTDVDIPGVTRRHRPSDFYHERTNFQFIAHSKRWAILSGTLMLISIVALVARGLNLGIEFKGGTSWQVTVHGGKVPSVPEVRNVLAPLHIGESKVSVLSGQGGRSVRVQARVLNDPVEEFSNDLAKYMNVTAADVVLARTPDGKGGTFTIIAKNNPTQSGVDAIAKRHGITGEKTTISGKNVTVVVSQLPSSPVDRVTNALATYANATPRDVSVSTVGPTWGSDVSRNAVKALIIFFILLAVYLALRFEWKMSVSAIIAVIHDIIFTVGMYALFQFPVTPATVTAFLTILGFSLYDTVVVFDKVLENQRALTATGRSTYGEMVNKSLNQVLMRSVSTSLVALLPVMSLLFIGSGIYGATALEEFALALAAGLFIGSYSSIFVAAPMLAWWKEKEPQYRALADRRRRVTVAAASASTGVPVVAPDDLGDTGERTNLGVPGPPAVGRSPIQARPRQQRGKKRR